jgi:cytochrome c oxidase cbb3-type subunit 3
MSSSSSVCSLICLLLMAACNRSRAAELAINGAPPALTNPVGVAPGPTEPTQALKNPFGDDSAAAQQGRLMFAQFNCGGCHGDHGGGGMGPSLRDGEWIYGSSDGALYGAIADGRARGMPAWGSRIPEPQVWQIVSYLRTLGTSTEPSAPSQIVPPPPFK